ncbi:trypsin-like peptidase domain-containing protein [Mesorhizobium sp. BHbsci]
MGPVLITNRHNFTGRDQNTGQPIWTHGGIPNRIGVWHNSFNGLGKWHRETYPLLDIEEKPLWNEHPTLGANADVVALRLTLNPLSVVRAYSLASPTLELLVMPGDPLSVIGFPFGLSAGSHFAIWATGFLATELDVDYDHRPIFLVDCRARQGQSGSPVVASRSGGMVPLMNGDTAAFSGPVANLLGIYSGRINEQSDLGIVWKKSVIAELVAAL